MRRQMCYFVVFQPSKVEMLIFRFQRLNFDQFDPFSQMTARSLLNKFKKTQKIWAGWGLWAGDIRVIYSGRRYVGYAWEVKSQKDCHLSHRKTKHFFTRWKVMCFSEIEFKKRSCWIAQDILLFLLWTSDTLPVQSSCFAPEMISFLRKAKIIFTPALETIISIHEDTYVESRIGVVENLPILQHLRIWGI